MSGKLIFNISFIFTAIIVMIISIGKSYNPYDNLWLLPLSFLIFFIVYWIPKINKNLKLSSGEIMIFIAITIRYLFIPLLIILNGNSQYSTRGFAIANDFDLAIIYLVYELVIIFCLLSIKFPSVRNPIQIINTQNNSLMFYKLIVAFGVLFLFLPQVRNRYNFFATDILLTSREVVSTYIESFNIFFYITNYAKILFPILVISIVYKYYQQNPRLNLVIITIIGTMLPNMFYIATSRNSIFLPLLASFFTMIYIFQYHRKFILSVYGIFILTVISIMSWMKVSSTSLNEFNMSWLTNYFSIYFLGPREYAIGIGAIDEFKNRIDFHVLINDIFSNIPIASSFTDIAERTTQYFNWYYYGTTSIGIGGGFIVPAGIQGAFHFGYLIGPIFFIVSILTLRICDSIIRKSKDNIATIYLANYAMIAASLFYANSISSLLNLLFFIILPLAFVNIIQRLNFRKFKWKTNGR